MITPIAGVGPFTFTGLESDATGGVVPAEARVQPYGTDLPFVQLFVVEQAGGVPSGFEFVRIAPETDEERAQAFFTFSAPPGDGFLSDGSRDEVRPLRMSFANQWSEVSGLLGEFSVLYVMSLYYARRSPSGAIRAEGLSTDMLVSAVLNVADAVGDVDYAVAADVMALSETGSISRASLASAVGEARERSRWMQVIVPRDDLATNVLAVARARRSDAQDRTRAALRL